MPIGYNNDPTKAKRVMPGVYLVGRFEINHCSHNCRGDRNPEPWYVGDIGKPADDTYPTLRDAVAACQRTIQKERVSPDGR